MNKTLHYTIKPEEAGLTVGCFLRKQGYSRHILTHLKQTEHGICLGSAPVYTSSILRSGDRLTVRIIEEHSSGQIQPAALPFPIVFEDEDILVIATGRTHQIRVHLAWTGHPLLGDSLYGKGDERIGRAALHAWKVHFLQPFTGEKITLQSDIPEDMMIAIRKTSCHNSSSRYLTGGIIL